MRNKMFARENSEFGKACVLANCKTTARQASKFQMKRGVAWGVLKQAGDPLKYGMPGYELHE